MTSVLLAPHNDDETLFASFTLLRDQPLVVVVLRSNEQREAETAAAMEVLGCEWEQWEFSEADPDWIAVAERIGDFSEEFDHCYAPTPHCVENGWDEQESPPLGFGIIQHDAVGLIAGDVFKDRVTFYETYTKFGGKTVTDNEVEFESQWVELKLRALAEYRSQIALWPEHFVASLREYRAD